jgi:hypothetical protein
MVFNPSKPDQNPGVSQQNQQEPTVRFQNSQSAPLPIQKRPCRRIGRVASDDPGFWGESILAEQRRHTGDHLA